MEVLYQEMYKMKVVEARKRLIKTYEKTNNIRKTAKLWEPSRLVVRKWIRRYKEKGEKGLEDASRKPKRSPGRTAQAIEEKVLKMRKEKDYGRRRRSAWFLLTEEKIKLFENTITHILRRAVLGRKKSKERYFIQQNGFIMKIYLLNWLRLIQKISMTRECSVL